MRAVVLDDAFDPVPPSSSPPHPSYNLSLMIATAKRNKIMGLLRIAALIFFRPALALILHRNIIIWWQTRNRKLQPWWSSVVFWMILALTCIPRLTNRFFQLSGGPRAGVYHAGHQTKGGRVAAAIQLQKKVDLYTSPFLNGDFSTIFPSATFVIANAIRRTLSRRPSLRVDRFPVTHRKHFLNHQKEVHNSILYALQFNYMHCNSTTLSMVLCHAPEAESSSCVNIRSLVQIGRFPRQQMAKVAVTAWVAKKCAYC